MVLEEAATAEIMFASNPETGLILPVDVSDAQAPAYPESPESEVIISAEQAEELAEHYKMKPADSGLVLPEEYTAKEGVIGKTANFLRNSRAGRAVTAFAIGASLAGGYSLLHADTARADDGTPVCTTSPGGDSTTCVYPPSNQPPATPNPTPDNPPAGGNGGHQGSGHHGHHHSHQPTDGFPDGFINYNQGDWGSRIASTGCGPTALAMVLATETGNKHITPKSVAHAITPTWYAYGSGTASGAFFDMGHRYDLAVRETNLHHAQKVLRAGGLAIVHAAPGYFTSAGHYMVLKRVVDGKFKIADPNGLGRHGNSESRKWTAGSLKSRGIDDVWTFRK